MLLRDFIRQTMIAERKSGRKILRTLKNQIASDIMALFFQDYGKIKGIGLMDVDPDDYEDDGIDYVERAYELQGYWWLKKVDPAELEPDQVELIKKKVVPSFDVTVAFVQDPRQEELNVAGRDITINNTTGMDVIIELPAGGLPREQYELLRGEIGNTVKHELEHLTQEGDLKSFERDEETYYNYEIPGKVDTKYAETYFLDPKEIGGHVMGYSDVTNSMQELETRIRKDLGGEVTRKKITPNDLDIIVKTWMSWAQKHLHAQKFKN